MQRHNGTPSGDDTARALEEYLAAAEAGRAPPREEFLARHPQLADDLDACLEALRFIGRAAEGPPLVAGLAEETPDDTPGQLGDFRLLREVGRGGMGVVYEAEQISLGRKVALKVLPYAATIDPRQLQRFHNEARAAASLHHEHIVPVYAVGCERGVHYYAMQFIDGRTLADMIQDLRAGPASVSEGPQTATVVWHPPRESVASVKSAADTSPVAALSTQVGRKDKAHYRWIAELIVQAADAL